MPSYLATPNRSSSLRRRRKTGSSCSSSPLKLAPYFKQPIMVAASTSPCMSIIGTRYPELDNVQHDIIQFGNYLQAEQCTRGGFLPIFWDAPYSYIQACTDIGEVVDWITDKFVRVIWRSSTTETKWSIPFPTRSGCQVQVVPSSRAVLRPVLV